MPMQQIISSQASPEIVINENFETLDHMAVYGKNPATTTALTWGYYGGRYAGLAINSGTLTLTASQTNYVVVQRSNGAISTSTSITNWNNTVTYARVYRIVTGTNTVSSYEDHRAGLNGVHGINTISGSLSGLSDVDFDPLPTDGQVLRYNNSTTKWEPYTIPPATSPVQVIPVACSDETTALTTGTAKVTFRMPYAFTLTDIRASLTTAQTSGNIFTVDVNESGVSILSTKLTIDNTEKTSTTAATARVISDTSLADDSEITIDIDQIGDGTAKGLKVYLIGTKV